MNKIKNYFSMLTVLMMILIGMSTFFTSKTEAAEPDTRIVGKAIGGRVWADINANSIQDDGEPSLGGIHFTGGESCTRSLQDINWSCEDLSNYGRFYSSYGSQIPVGGFPYVREIPFGDENTAQVMNDIKIALNELEPGLTITQQNAGDDMKDSDFNENGLAHFNYELWLDETQPETRPAQAYGYFNQAGEFIIDAEKNDERTQKWDLIDLGLVPNAAILLDMILDGQIADEDQITVNAGTAYTVTYNVTNTGPSMLQSVNVNGAICGVATLLPGETTTCTKSGIATEDTVFDGTATGIFNYNHMKTFVETYKDGDITYANFYAPTTNGYQLPVIEGIDCEYYNVPPAEPESSGDMTCIVKEGYTFPQSFEVTSKGPDLILKTATSSDSVKINVIQPPTTEEPTAEAPTTETPTTEAPTTEAPTTEVPTTEAPTTEAPTTEAPTTEAPTTEVPTTEVPTTETPTTEAPTTEVPTTEVPTTETPTTEVPTTEVPTTETPTTETPTTEAPITEAPATPTTETPATPTTETPATPTTEQPSTETPTTEAPTTEAPTTEVPTTEVPTTETPTTEAPTTEVPTTEVPTTETPTAEVPTTETPTTGTPTTEVPMVVISSQEQPAPMKPTITNKQSKPNAPVNNIKATPSETSLPDTGETALNTGLISLIFATVGGLIVISSRRRKEMK